MVIGAPIDLSAQPLVAAPTGPVAFAAPALPNFAGPRTDGRGTASWYDTGLKGVGERFGDWLNTPGTAAQLFRSGAATLQGGLGAGLAAGAAEADHQRAVASGAQQQVFENAMSLLKQHVEQQQADQTGQYQRGQLGIDAARVGETTAHDRASEGLERSGQQVQVYGIDQNNATSRANTAANNATSITTNAATNATSAANNVRETTAKTYGDNLGFYGGIDRANIEAGAKTPGWIETTTKNPGTNPWPWQGPAVPPSVTKTRTPVTPSEPTRATLSVGAVVGGHTYLGGDPNSRSSWR